MNYIYISPNSPANFYQFSVALNKEGIDVLGIGDCPYENLDYRLQESLTDYVCVKNLYDDQEVHDVINQLKMKYGPIDWIETNLENYLIKIAEIRTIFDVKNGLRIENAEFLRSQIKMKELLKEAGVKLARYYLIDDFANTKKFVKTVGYPIIIKSNDLLSEREVIKIEDEDQLKAFFDNLPNEQMIAEEFINGDLTSYDGITNGDKNILIDSVHVYPRKILDVKDKSLDFFYWSIKEIPLAFKEASQSIVATFPMEKCCFRIEFFILQEDKVGLGERGDIIGLEVHLCAFTGFSTDMVGYGSDNDFYEIYAKMVKNDCESLKIKPYEYYVVYASRKDSNHYLIPFCDIQRLFKTSIVLEGYNSQYGNILGDRYLIAKFKNADDIWTFINAVVETNK